MGGCPGSPFSGGNRAFQRNPTSTSPLEIDYLGQIRCRRRGSRGASIPFRGNLACDSGRSTVEGYSSAKPSRLGRTVVMEGQVGTIPNTVT